MVVGLDEFPTLLPSLTKMTFQPLHSSITARVMNKALSCLIAFDDVCSLAGDLRDLMKRDLIFPLNHLGSPFGSTQSDRIFIDEVVWKIRFLGLSQPLLSQVLLPIHVGVGGPVML